MSRSGIVDVTYLTFCRYIECRPKTTVPELFVTCEGKKISNPGKELDSLVSSFNLKKLNISPTEYRKMIATKVDTLRNEAIEHSCSSMMNHSLTTHRLRYAFSGTVEKAISDFVTIENVRNSKNEKVKGMETSVGMEDCGRESGGKSGDHERMEGGGESGDHERMEGGGESGDHERMEGGGESGDDGDESDSKSVENIDGGVLLKRRFYKRWTEDELEELCKYFPPEGAFLRISEIREALKGAPANFLSQRSITDIRDKLRNMAKYNRIVLHY